MAAVVSISIIELRFEACVRAIGSEEYFIVPDVLQVPSCGEFESLARKQALGLRCQVEFPNVELHQADAVVRREDFPASPERNACLVRRHERRQLDARGDGDFCQACPVALHDQQLGIL
ncbi:hypothetical protein D9M68_905080 [compost metagenome]